MPSPQQDPFRSPTVTIDVPDLGVADSQIQLLNWLVRPGTQLIAGERVAELLADSVLFHLESEVNGELIRLIVGSGSSVSSGQPIAEVLITEEDPRTNCSL